MFDSNPKYKKFMTWPDPCTNGSGPRPTLTPSVLCFWLWPYLTDKLQFGLAMTGKVGCNLQHAERFRRSEISYKQPDGTKAASRRSMPTDSFVQYFGQEWKIRDCSVQLHASFWSNPRDFLRRGRLCVLKRRWDTSVRRDLLIILIMNGANRWMQFFNNQVDTGSKELYFVGACLTSCACVCDNMPPPSASWPLTFSPLCLSHMWRELPLCQF